MVQHLPYWGLPLAMDWGNLLRIRYLICHIDKEIKKTDSKACTYQGVKFEEARATEVDSSLDSTTSNPTPPIQPSDLSGHVQQHTPHPKPVANPCTPGNAPKTWKRIPQSPQDGDSAQCNTLPHKRSLTTDDDFDLPRKKRVFSHDEVISEFGLAAAASQPCQEQ